MKKISRASKIISLDSIAMVFLLLASMNTINRYYYFIFIAFAVFLIMPGRRIIFDYSVASLFVLALSWAIFAPASMTSIWGPIKPFAYAMCYLMGASFINKKAIQDGKEFQSFYCMVTIVASGPFIHYLLNWIKNGNADERNTIDFWTNSVMSATGQAALACIPLGLAIACFLSKSAKRLKLLSAAVIVLVLGYNLVLAGRTLVALFLIIFAVGLLFLLKHSKGRRLRMLLILIAVVLLIALVYQTNLFGIRETIESSSLYNRFFGEHAMDLNEDGRMAKKWYFISNLQRFPFGGANLREERGYAHDILLDTYDEAGIFALLALLTYLATAFVRFVKCMKSKSLPFEFKQVVLCVYLIVCIEFFIEPILQGMPWLFASFCLIDGYVGRILSIDNAKKREVRANANC